MLITGVANPEPLINFLIRKKIDFEHIKFSNHHQFKQREIKEIKKIKKDKILLTTEKDYGRLKPYFSYEELFYIPVYLDFFSFKDSKKFNDIISASLFKS